MPITLEKSCTNPFPCNLYIWAFFGTRDRILVIHSFQLITLLSLLNIINFDTYISRSNIRERLFYFTVAWKNFKGRILNKTFLKINISFLKMEEKKFFQISDPTCCFIHKNKSFGLMFVKTKH